MTRIKIRFYLIKSFIDKLLSKNIIYGEGIIGLNSKTGLDCSLALVFGVISRRSLQLRC
jgi:hypothetical protein